MANANAPFGLRPVRSVGGRPYSGSFEVFTVAASDGTAIYIGDCVTTTGVGTAQTVDGVVYQDCIIAASTDIIDGVVVGVLPDTNASLPYRAASTLRRLAVCTDPDMLYEARETNGGTALVASDIGSNISLSVVAGSTVTGLSKTVLDNTATHNITNTLTLKLIGFVNSPDNAIGASAKWLVRINSHRLANLIIGV